MPSLPEEEGDALKSGLGEEVEKNWRLEEVKTVKLGIALA